MQIFNLSGKDAEKKVFETLIKESDVNGDGELSLKEFITMMEMFMSVKAKK